MFIDVVMYELDIWIGCLEFYNCVVFIWNDDSVFLYWIVEVYVRD